jgi:hypothetical protein
MGLTYRLASIAVAVAVISCFSGGSIYARGATDSDTSAKAADSSGKSDVSVSRRGKTNEKVRADMLKLLADAKAGKVSTAPASQFPATKGNNLSKTAKIAIVAGVVLVVLAIIVVHDVKNLDCKSRCVL